MQVEVRRGAPGAAGPTGTVLALPSDAPSRHRRGPVPDLAYVLVSVAFFAVAWVYALACERL